VTEQHQSCEADTCSGWLPAFYIPWWFTATVRMLSYCV